MQNLFTDLPGHLAGEVVQLLAEGRDVRIERIVSCGQASPPGFWYDQEQHEWVAVLKGRAKLSFWETADVLEMKPGDWLSIRAHQRHRVEWTTPDEPTVWLAVFFSAE
jgi:cupin 2 domain-containing protein